MSNATSQQIQSATVATKPAQFTISFEIEGFPVTAQLEGKADSLKAMIDRLKAIGATPPAKIANASPASAGKAIAPVCPIHNTPMKASRKPGSFFCPRQMDDGRYCSEKAA